MTRLITLILSILLAVASLCGVIYLTDRITSGEQKLAEGQKQYNEGQIMLAAGKAKLASGEQRLESGKKTYKTLGFIPIIAVAKILPITSSVFKAQNKKISDGQILIAKGQAKIKAGEAQLKTGRLQLEQGKEKLNYAKGIRRACVFSTVFFILLSVILGLCWRRKL